jgi:hypothetical protein
MPARVRLLRAVPLRSRYLRLGGSSGAQRKGNARLRESLPSNGSEDLTEQTSVCVCNSEFISIGTLSVKSRINPVINRKPSYSHTKIVVLRSLPLRCEVVQSGRR